jgi:hypothetical protein
MPLTEQEILDRLRDGQPRRIYGGRPRDVYFDLAKRGLIKLEMVEIDDQESAVEITLLKQS